MKLNWILLASLLSAPAFSSYDAHSPQASQSDGRAEDAQRAYQSRPQNLDVCFSPEGACDRKLIALIDSAAKNLDIAIFSITHEGITSAILRAKKRGVRVRMVVDRRESAIPSSTVPKLTKAGIALKIGNFRGIMHNKFTIADGQMLETGSYNYSANATDNNAENQIYLDDARVIASFVQNFNSMFVEANPAR